MNPYVSYSMAYKCAWNARYYSNAGISIKYILSSTTADIVCRWYHSLYIISYYKQACCNESVKCIIKEQT